MGWFKFSSYTHLYDFKNVLLKTQFVFRELRSADYPELIKYNQEKNLLGRVTLGQTLYKSFGQQA